MKELLMGCFPSKRRLPRTDSEESIEELNLDWEIESSNIKIGAILGNGYYHTTHKARLYDGDVVVKVLKKCVSAQDFKKEVAITSYFKHENIIRTIGVCTAKRYIIQEFMSGGDLKTYMKNRCISADQSLIIAEKIASAMAYLELRRIVHMDLSARNVLVGATLDTIKLNNCETALEISQNNKRNKHDFPYKWAAPESFEFHEQEKDELTTASNVWSFAVVMWELYSNGAEPYDDIGWISLYYRLTKDNFRLSRPDACPETVYAKMLECWSLEPQQRPTFAQLHEFLLEMGPKKMVPIIPLLKRQLELGESSESKIN